MCKWTNLDLCIPWLGKYAYNQEKALCNRLFIVERNAVTNRLGSINAIYYLLHAWVPHPE